jgi:hypothetical protein
MPKGANGPSREKACGVTASRKMSAARIPANRNKRPRRKRGNLDLTPDGEFPVATLSAGKGDSVPDYPFERRAWATDREPARSASPLIARLGSTSGALFVPGRGRSSGGGGGPPCGGGGGGPVCDGGGGPACALGTANERARVKSEYFRIVFKFLSFRSRLPIVLRIGRTIIHSASA